MNQIVLVGAPASGKTTVGKAVADRLGWSFTDIDDEIEKSAGKPISEIFADDGEAYFRELEQTHTLAQLTKPGVISLGGGAVMNAAIREALADHVVVWLQVSISHATKRVGMNQARPLLLGNVRARLIELLHQRMPFYQQVATFQIETDDLAPDEICELIVSRYEELGRA